MEFAIIGLGRIGGNLARQALERGIRVIGQDLHGIDEELKHAGVTEAPQPGELRTLLSSPRIVILYVPAGPVVDTLLDSLENVLEPGDVVIDGGNSYWGDSRRRHDRLQERGIGFVDAGTSGGIPGARHGASFMLGGENHWIERVQPLLEELAVPGGIVHAGGPGTGHYAKLVHNGIEFAMLQAIGEGMTLLERYREEMDPIDIPGVLECWRHGSVIRSWLIDLIAQSYRDHKGLQDVPAHVEDTGEVDWLISDALHLEASVPLIAGSVMQLRESRDGTHHAPRAIALMRQGFGGHPLGHEPTLHKERKQGRVGGFPE